MSKFDVKSMKCNICGRVNEVTYLAMGSQQGGPDMISDLQRCAVVRCRYGSKNVIIAVMFFLHQKRCRNMKKNSSTPKNM